MSVRTSELRTWPKIFAARGDGPGKGIPPMYLTPPRHDFLPTESKHENAKKLDQEFSLQIEQMFKETAREQGLSSRKTRKQQSGINDEEALAGIMEEISNDVESFHTMYSNKWFINKSKASDVIKPVQHSLKPDAPSDVIKLNEFPSKVRSNSGIQFTKNVLNRSSLPDVALHSSMPKIREQDEDLESELRKLSLKHKSVPPTPSHIERVTRSQKTVPPSPTHTEYMGIGVMSPKTTQTENVISNTQAQMFGDTNTTVRSQSTEAQSELDGSEKALTESERQTFKDAINAMNAEAERREKRASKESSKSMAAHRSGLSHTSKEYKKSAGASEKTSIWPSSSIGRVDVKKYSRQSVAEKGVKSQATMYTPQHTRKLSNVSADKHQKAAGEPVTKTEMHEKQKETIRHGFPYTKPMSLSSIPNIKNGNFQAGFVKSVPIETGVLHISSSAPLVSKHYATKNMPPTTSQSKFQRRRTQVK